MGMGGGGGGGGGVGGLGGGARSVVQMYNEFLSPNANMQKLNAQKFEPLPIQHFANWISYIVT